MNLAALLLMTIFTCISPSSSGHFDCPLPQHLSPCTCEQGEQGLDVTCADTTALQLREGLDVVSLTRQTLYYLRVTRAQLDTFHAALFEELDLRNLVLVESNLTAIGSFKAWDSAGRLESMDLSRNRLNRVPSMSGLVSLSALNLDFNAIETLEAHVFGDLVSLLWLSLYGNRIRLIDSRAFLGTEASLTRLNLGGNLLGGVPRYALQRLNCLQGLRLQENNVSDVPVEHLPVSLCDLDLSGNHIERLKAEAFVTLRHLSALDLENNKIRVIHEDAFSGLYDSLEWLKLGGNSLPSVPTSALRNFTRLRQLDLRSNLISKLEVESFHSYGRTLKFIFLQKNRIQEIEDGALDVLESIEWLYLHSNALEDVKQETFQTIIDNLHVLDLHDNPYRCNCGILWFRDWLRSKGQNVVNLPNETRCNSTSNSSHQPIVKLTNSSVVCSGSWATSFNNLTVVLIFLLWIFS